MDTFAPSPTATGRRATERDRRLVAPLKRDRAQFDRVRFDIVRAASRHRVDAVEHFTNGTKVAAFGEFKQAASDASVQRHAVAVDVLQLSPQFDRDRTDADRSARRIPRMTREPSPAHVA